MHIIAGELTPDAFAPYGRVHAMDSGERAPGLVVTSGDGWSDCYTREPLLSRNASLGMTVGGPAPFETARMERHLLTEEALFCAGEPIVLAVAAPTNAAAPRAEAIRAFVIRPGTVVVMNPGTWHDACRGLDKPTAYYWMATCGEEPGSPWIDVEGGPVRVAVAR